jgi:hypothetical protein
MREAVVVTVEILGFGLVLLAGFLRTLRTGRFISGVMLCWGLFAGYMLALALIGTLWSRGDPELGRLLPEGPHVMLACVLGWIHGAIVAGVALLVRRARAPRAASGGGSGEAEEEVTEQRLAAEKVPAQKPPFGGE